MVKSYLLDRTFAALSDPTRREILERLTSGQASISDLAAPLGISLPGVMKHVRILEQSNLVRSEKQGRSRICRLGTGRLEEAMEWIEWYRQEWERRLDRLESHLESKKGTAS